MEEKRAGAKYKENVQSCGNNRGIKLMMTVYSLQKEKKKDYWVQKKIAVWCSISEAIHCVQKKRCQTGHSYSRIQEADVAHAGFCAFPWKSE